MREDAGVAAFVAVGEGATGDVIAIGLECRLDLEQLFLADHAALHAVAAHHFHGVASCVERLLIGVEMGNAAFQTVEFEVGAANHVFECCVTIGTQSDDLLHVAFKSRVIALAQELHQPGPLVWIHLRAQQQRGLFVEQPLDGFPRGFAIGPGLAVAHRDLCAVGKTGLQRRIGLSIDNNHFVAALQEVPCSRNADDAGAKDNGFHGLECAVTCVQIIVKLKFFEKHQFS